MFDVGVAALMFSYPGGGAGGGGAGVWFGRRKRDVVAQVDGDEQQHFISTPDAITA